MGGRPQVGQGDGCFSWLAAFLHLDDGNYNADSPQTVVNACPVLAKIVRDFTYRMGGSRSNAV